MLDVKRSRVAKPPSSKPQTKSSKSKILNRQPPLLDKTLSNEFSTVNPDPTAPSSKMPSSIPPSSSTTPQILTTVLKPLASSTPSLRRNALNQLLDYLRSPTAAPLTKTQALQIHRALYVALYMHDSKSAVSVQNLARTIAGTVKVMLQRDLNRQLGEEDGTDADDDEKSEFAESVTWATAFWEEIAREWVGIDQWRMNKVLMLVRFWVVESVDAVRKLAGLLGGQADNAQDDPDNDELSAIAAKANDDGLAWQAYLADIASLPLESTTALPDGLRMHVLDVWGDELEGLAASSSEEDGQQGDVVHKKRKEVLKALAVPVKELSVFHDGAEVPNMPKNVRTRAKEVLKKAEV